MDKLSTGLAELSTEMTDLSTDLSTGYSTKLNNVLIKTGANTRILIEIYFNILIIIKNKFDTKNYYFRYKNDFLPEKR